MIRLRLCLLIVGLLCLEGLVAFAQPKGAVEQAPPLEPAEGRRQARVLVDSLVRLKPQENVTQNLLFRITDKDDRELSVPAWFQMVCGSNDFVSVYETVGGNGSAAMKLTIFHAEGQSNRYVLNQPPNGPQKKLESGQLFVPFAGSDFWLTDLGLDFLQWPQQRVLKKQMRKSVFCDVLESINPYPVAGSYSKVVSWIGANHPDELVIVHADAYDVAGRLLKQFDPRKLEKVNGVYQLEEMEIRNRQTGSSTKIDFQLRP